MVEQFNQIFQKDVLAEERKHGQRYRVARNRDQRARGVGYAVRRMLGKITAAQQRALQQIPAIAARGGNDFVYGRFLRPHEDAAFLYHSTEEIDVFACGVELHVERLVVAFENRL